MGQAHAKSQFSASQLADFYDTHFLRVYRYFYYKVLSTEIAEDLTSETFLVVAEKLANEPIDNPTAFLLGTARIKLQSFIKQKYRLPMADVDISTAAEQVEPVPGKDFAAIVAAQIENLPPQQAEIIRLRIQDKLTIPGIAGLLGKNSSYVRTTQNRAIKSLKKLLACIPPDTNM